MIIGGMISGSDSLFDRSGFAGHTGLVHQKSRRLDKFGVGSNKVSLRQHQGITRHDIGGGDFSLPTVANHSGAWRAQAGKSGDGAIRPYLLDHPDGRVHHDYQCDHCRIGQVADSR
jgi:hypothetical protein